MKLYALEGQIYLKKRGKLYYLDGQHAFKVTEFKEEK